MTAEVKDVSGKGRRGRRIRNISKLTINAVEAFLHLLRLRLAAALSRLGGKTRVGCGCFLFLVLLLLVGLHATALGRHVEITRV